MPLHVCFRADNPQRTNFVIFACNVTEEFTVSQRTTATCYNSYGPCENHMGSHPISIVRHDYIHLRKTESLFHANNRIQNIGGPGYFQSQRQWYLLPPFHNTAQAMVNDFVALASYRLARSGHIRPTSTRDFKCDHAILHVLQ